MAAQLDKYIRVSSDVHERLLKAAERRSTTIGALTTLLLEDALDHLAPPAPLTRRDT